MASFFLTFELDRIPCGRSGALPHGGTFLAIGCEKTSMMRDIVENVSKLPLLGGGTITGLLEMLGLFSISAAIIAMPAMHELSQRVKLAALLATFYFTLQAVLFTRIPSEFLYFQF